MIHPRNLGEYHDDPTKHDCNVAKFAQLMFQIRIRRNRAWIRGGVVIFKGIHPDFI